MYLEGVVGCSVVLRPPYGNAANRRRRHFRFRREPMPGRTATQDIELIVDNTGGGGGGKEPPAGGDGGGDGDKGRRPRKPPQRRYSTAIVLGMISILMFFLGLCIAFIALKRGSET